MKKISRLGLTILPMVLVNLMVTSCTAKPSEEHTVAAIMAEDVIIDAGLVQEKGQEEKKESIENPGQTFTSQKVLGLNARDAKAFGEAMQNAGWSPEVTCLGTYCDIGTRDHFETAATIVFLSGHGYVGNPNGFFRYSNLDAGLHKYVDRSDEQTEYYTHNDESVWPETEEYSHVVFCQQKQTTDWLVIAACNQLRADTRVSVFEAMNEPSDRPLKGVLGYGSYQGSNRDGLVLKKFVALCQNGAGKERVAHAWFAAHEAYAPTLSPRARVALRDGFQDATLTSQGAERKDSGNQIRLWWMSRGNVMPEANTDIPETVIIEIEVSAAANNLIAVTDIAVTDPGDIPGSQEQAVAAAEEDGRIPGDFQLYRTNTIIESDMDGENEVPAATLHTFARYIDGIRVSVDPEQGEYLSLLMDGTNSAELDLVARCQTEINIEGARMAARTDLLPKEEIVSLGLESSRQLQAEHYGYSPEELTLKSIEPVYVVPPSEPHKMVLAWNVIDDQGVYVIVDARSGEVLYWSD